MSRQALVIVDFQNDYLPDGRMPLEGIQEAIDQASTLLAATRLTDIPVVHVRHEFAGDDAPFFAPGTAGAAIIDALGPEPHERVFLKRHPNAFRDTGLHAFLGGEEIKSLLIIGAMSHVCIDATVRAAVDLGYDVTVAHDAVATRALTFGETTVPATHVHAAFMSALAFAYARVVRVQDLLRADK